MNQSGRPLTFAVLGGAGAMAHPRADTAKPVYQRVPIGETKDILDGRHFRFGSKADLMTTDANVR